jgi:hypothetical protein
VSALEMVPVLIGDGEYVAIPASGHELVLVIPSPFGGDAAICFCGEARTGDTAEDAADALDAHLREVQP